MKKRIIFTSTEPFTGFKPVDLDKREEKQYLDNLFAHVDRANVRQAYVEPVIARLVKHSVDYDVAFRALKRAANELAANWKLEHGPMGGLGISKAAQVRQVEVLARSFMEIYLIRRAAYLRENGQ